MPPFGIPVKSSNIDLMKGKLNATPNVSSEMSLDGWDGIYLDYSVDWPLELFFTQEVISK